MVTLRVAMLSIAACIPSMAGAVEEPNLCERLALQIGLKQVWLSEPEGRIEEWRMNNASLKDHLFGGTVATSIGMDPADVSTATGDDFRRFAEMCEQTREGAICKIVGPARLQVATRRGVAKIDASAGERATVGIRGTTVYCRKA